MLADDHAIVRAGLAALLSREQDIEVVGVVASGEELLDLLESVEPDVAVLDYQLPGKSGTEVCAIITERHPGVKVIVLSSYIDDRVVMGSFDAGASAYVYKDVDAAELKRAIREVASGKAVLDGHVTRRLLAWTQRRRKVPHGEWLSLREVEVLRHVAAGSSNQEIAVQLGISLNTVKTYLRRASEKLGCQSRAEAVATATKRGLL